MGSQSSSTTANRDTADPSTSKERANEAYAAASGQLAKADSAPTRFLLLGPTTEMWQDAINETVKNARCNVRRANHFKSDNGRSLSTKYKTILVTFSGQK